MKYKNKAMALIDIIFIVFESIIVVFLILCWYIIRKEKNNKKDDYQLNTTKIALVKAALSWGLTNIPNSNKRNKTPSLEISYVKSKKYHGIYFSHNNSICIYVNTHTDVKALCDTVLHEYKHHIDMPTTALKKQYNTYTEKLGYYDNPFEKAARAFALQHRENCMHDLYKAGYLK